MLDGDDNEKYHHRKKTTTYRNQIQSLICIIILPVAATVTTDVWYESAILLSSFGYELVLAITNVSGAFLDGFFSAFESGSIIPSDYKTEALHLIAYDMRAYSLSTYTSWSGMVGVAASLAHVKSSVSIGILYIILSIVCAFVAHGLGSDFAQYISSRISDSAVISNKPYMKRAHTLLEHCGLSLVIYITISYIYLGEENIEESPEYDVGKWFWVVATPRNQLLISSIFAILGAYIGNLIVEIISNKLRHPLIPMETLVCNWLFGMLGLSLNVMKLIDASWGDSLILRGFALNFCGAASLFSRHASDNRRLYTTKVKRGATTSRRRALMKNMSANIIFATIVFWVAFEIEEWEVDPLIRRGAVVKIMKILEKRRANRIDEE